jgi:hypothetical protein
MIEFFIIIYFLILIELAFAYLYQLVKYLIFNFNFYHTIMQVYMKLWLTTFHYLIFIAILIMLVLNLIGFIR